MAGADHGRGGGVSRWCGPAMWRGSGQEARGPAGPAFRDVIVKGDLVKGWLILALAVVLIAIGAVWTLQGLGYLAGSPMTGVQLWAIVGPIVGLVGLVLGAAGVRQLRSR